MRQTYQGNEPYIFISYAHKDSDQVFPIIESFMDRGFRVWYDSAIEAGKEWSEDIAERIVNCSVLIAFLSPNYVNSHNCREELLFAREERKDMFIAQLEEAKLTPGMRMRLGGIQHKFAWNYPNMEAFIAELCSAQIVQPCLGTAVRKSDPGLKTPAPAPKSSFESLLEKAKRGDAQAQLQVGDAYYNGESVEKDLTKAAYWYQKAAQQGLAEAQHKWAWALCYGEGTTKNLKAAAEWWQKSAAQGFAKAQNALAYCYFKGEGVPQSYKQAMEWFQKAAEQGNIRALRNISKMYKNGTGVNKDPEEAARWLEKAAELGDVQSQKDLGLYYKENRWLGGTDRSDLVLKWYKKAAEQGDADAQLSVGLIMNNLFGGYDKEEGFQWLLKAAEQGNVQAMYQVALCYGSGSGVRYNSEEAVKWDKKAADKGHVEAMKQLAECYEYGSGVPKDRAEARRLRRLAKKTK